MIFQIMLFWIASITTATYPMQRQVHIAPVEPVENELQQPVVKVIELIKAVNKSSGFVHVGQNLSITLSPPLSALTEFRSGAPVIAQINGARMAIKKLAYVLQLCSNLIAQDKLSSLYTYLRKDSRFFLRHPEEFDGTTAPQDIVAHYVAACYQPIVNQKSKSTFFGFNQTTDLVFQDKVQKIIDSGNDAGILQISELLNTISNAWGYFAILLTDSNMQTKVRLSHPAYNLTINAWRDITSDTSKDLFYATKEGEAALRDERAQLEERRAISQANILHKTIDPTGQKSAQKLSRAEKEQQLAALKAKTRQALEQMNAQSDELAREHAAQVEQIMQESSKQLLLESLKAQAFELEQIEEIIAITEPKISLVNDELNAILDACQAISTDQLELVDSTVKDSFVKTYEWLQESIDSDMSQDPEDAFLQLRYEFKNQKLRPEIEFVLRKAVYAWNMYAFIRYAGNLQSKVSLQYSPRHTETKTIHDWITFTKNAGFTYSGEFIKLLTEKPTTPIRTKIANFYQWAKQKMARKPAPKLSQESTEELNAQMEKGRAELERQEQAELEKIKRVMRQNERRIQNVTTELSDISGKTSSIASTPPRSPSQNSVDNSVATVSPKSPSQSSRDNVVVTLPKYEEFPDDFSSELQAPTEELAP